MTSKCTTFVVSILLVVISVLVGMAMVRVLWAEDLSHAIYIDKVRSDTETYLSRIIDIQKKVIDRLQSQVDQWGTK